MATIGRNEPWSVMTPQYCPKCGSPLKPGQEFCVVCGARLDSWQDGNSEDVDLDATRVIDGEENELGPVSDELGHTRSSGDGDERAGAAEAGGTVPTADSGKTSHEDAAEEAATPRHGDGTFDVIDSSKAPIMAPISADPTRGNIYRSETDDKAWNSDKVLVIVAVAIAASLIAVIFMFMSSCGTGFDDPQQDEVEEVVNGVADTSDSSSSDTSDSSASDDSSSSEADTETEEQKAQRVAIQEYSDKLADYRSQVDDLVQKYQDEYGEQRTTREADAQEVTDLTTEIQSELDGCSALAYGSDTPYYQQWTATTQCYTDLVTTLQTVSYYWTQDLYYNYPSYYPDRLLDPFVTETESGDIYNALADYDTNYDLIVFENADSSDSSSSS